MPGAHDQLQLALIVMPLPWPLATGAWVHLPLAEHQFHPGNLGKSLFRFGARLFMGGLPLGMCHRKMGTLLRTDPLWRQVNNPPAIQRR